MVTKNKLTILLDPALRKKLTKFIKGKRKNAPSLTEEEIGAEALKTYIAAMPQNDDSNDSDLDELIAKVALQNKTNSRERDS